MDLFININRLFRGLCTFYIAVISVYKAVIKHRSYPEEDSLFGKIKDYLPSFLICCSAYYLNCTLFLDMLLCSHKHNLIFECR